LAKEESLRMTGVVHEVLPNAMFRVLLPNNHKVIATLGGKMRQHNIQILLGDSVDIEVSPYDINRGRVVYRNKS
jgi:translation initiation factor IF-1